MRARQPKSKYGNVKTNGYDSTRESERARQLRQMEKDGRISDLREQVRYELIPAQYEEFERIGKRGTPIKPGKRCIEKSVCYVADFVYVDPVTGETVVEDAKGFRTDDYIIKRKLMLFVHGIRIREV